MHKQKTTLAGSLFCDVSHIEAPSHCSCEFLEAENPQTRLRPRPNTLADFHAVWFAYSSGAPRVPGPIGVVRQLLHSMGWTWAAPDLISRPDMTYGWSKLTGEYLAKIVAEKYGIHVTCVRPFSGYGEGQDFSYPIPSIVQRFVNKENPIEVWGDGEQIRDFVHIDDVIECMIIALNKISDGSAVNIGSGFPVSFNAVINKLAEISGHSPGIKPLPHILHINLCIRM